MMASLAWENCSGLPDLARPIAAPVPMRMVTAAVMEVVTQVERRVRSLIHSEDRTPRMDWLPVNAEARAAGAAVMWLSFP